MDLSIVNQIRELQEMRSKCISILGSYINLDIAIAALQICENYGLDMTARIISTLKQLNIVDNEELKNKIIKSNKDEPMMVIKNDKNVCCPHCNSIVKEESKYCNQCGQRLKYDN